MPLARRSLCPFAAFLAILIGGKTASAATLTQTRLVAAPDDGLHRLVEPDFDERFNIADFRLDSVDFQFSVQIEGGVRLENRSTSARTITTSIGANLTLSESR